MIDTYLTKKETRQKLVPNSIRELTNPGTPPQFNVYWDNGLRFKSEDGNFKLKIGGRIMSDWGWLTEEKNILENVGDQVDGTEFRRARFYLSGEIYKNIGFKAQYDFAGGGRPRHDMYAESTLKNVGSSKLMYEKLFSFIVVLIKAR